MTSIDRGAQSGRSKRTIRLIGVFKLVKATLLVLLAFGAFRAAHGGVVDSIHELARVLRVDPHGAMMEGLIAKVSGVSPERLRLLSLGTLVYAALFATEGIGLLLAKVWAEWLAVVSTAGFIPLEILSLVRHATALHVVVLIVNIVIVAYLLLERLRSRGERKPKPRPSSWVTSSSARASQV
jgi:uncharacterized membrane protein (DUF2068 family)